MARNNLAGVIANLTVFLDIVENMDMGPLDHFTCSEVNALADVMAADRGEQKGMQVILDHFWDSDEEPDELAAHLEDWPGLREAIRSRFSADSDIALQLDELEAEGR